MKLVSRLLAVLFVVTWCWVPVQAHASTPTPGLGVVAEPTVLFAGAVGGEGHGYFIVAYRLSQGVRVFAFDATAPVGIAPYDDVVLESDVLQVNPVTNSPGTWTLTLEAELPTIGSVSLTAISDQLTAQGKGCQGLANYYFVSTTSHLTFDGNVTGSVDGHAIQSWQCMTWGWDVAGSFLIPPLGETII